MKAWAVIVLVLALLGTILNLTMGTPVQLILHDSILFLVALGILVRIRFKTREGEKEKLRLIIDESTRLTE
jgi:hypothetical protein